MLISFLQPHIVLRFAVFGFGFEVIDVIFPLLAELVQEVDGGLVAGMGFEVLLVDVEVGRELF